MALKDICHTYPIDGTGVGGPPSVHTVYTPDVDSTFVVFSYWFKVENPGYTPSGYITFRSGNTELSGNIAVVQGEIYQDGTGEGIVFRGREVGESFNILNTSGVVLSGYFIIAQEKA